MPFQLIPRIIRTSNSDIGRIITFANFFEYLFGFAILKIKRGMIKNVIGYVVSNFLSGIFLFLTIGFHYYLARVLALVFAMQGCSA